MSTHPASLAEPIAHPAAAGPKRRRRWRWVLGGGAALALAAVGAMTLTPAGPDPKLADVPLFTVKRGPLTISVSQAGTIRSGQAVTLRSEVEGRPTILRLVDEGTHVKKGDLLVELDSSDLQDRKVDEDIIFQNADAAFIQAREDLEITQKQAEADVQSAQVALELAKLDLEKYLKGEYEQQLQDAQSKVTVAKGTLQQAIERLNWSERLAKENYITSTDLQTDRFAKEQAELSLASAQTALDLLQKYTYQRTLTELQSTVREDTFLLDKAKHKGKASIVQAQANLRAKQLARNREKEKLDKLGEQITKCRIVAPVDGMVVYATSNGRSSRGINDQPLAEGVEVREMQDLIRLPTTAQMIADVKIHESLVEKVHVGQQALITTEALPGRTFAAIVHKIALLPDSQNVWLNPDLKVYNTEIEVQGNTDDLRPGMSCRAEVIIAELPSALFVPLQSVIRVGNQPTVYVMPPGGPPVARDVKVGLDNGRMVQITAGLRDGDRVMLDPPLPTAVRTPRPPTIGADHPARGKDSRPAPPHQKDQPKPAAKP